MTVTRVPRRGQKVHVDGEQGTFIAVRIDKIDNLATVELWDDPRVVRWDVPFRAIHLVREPETEAA
jgi:hypothetical protein